MVKNILIVMLLVCFASAVAAQNTFASRGGSDSNESSGEVSGSGHSDEGDLEDENESEDTDEMDDNDNESDNDSNASSTHATSTRMHDGRDVDEDDAVTGSTTPRAEHSVIGGIAENVKSMSQQQMENLLALLMKLIALLQQQQGQ